MIALNRNTPENTNLWRGAVLALMSAIAYSSSFVLTASALDESTQPLTMTMCRFGAVVIVLGLWLYRQRGFIPLYSVSTFQSAVLGVFHFLGNFAIMVALTIAPASITIVLFYTFPAIVLLFSCLLDRRLPSVTEILTVVVAITGVSLTVQFGEHGIPPFGVALALGAAVCVAIMMLGTQRLSRGASSLGITFNLALSATALAIVVTVISGSFGLPASTDGWIMLAFVMVLYPVALTCAVLAIGEAGALTVALVLCIEPVLTVVLSVLFRDELLSQRQYFGVALVIGAVIFMQLIRARRGRAQRMTSRSSRIR